MTCICGYQFCYVCGKDWTPPHYGDHDENGELIRREEQTERRRNDDFADCECDCDNCSFVC